ncbi:MAG: TRAP transporter substrate-binding protein [Planctomycetaceae bacterium]|nr:TRAP transporter substrate-binding protein [Planctomycetaceae bacterium]
MSKTRLFLATLFAFVPLLTLAAVAEDEMANPSDIQSKYKEGDAEYVFVICTPVGLDSVNHFIAWNAKHMMEEKSNGRIFANIYEASSLGGERETIEGMQNGSIDFFVTISAGYVPFAPKTGVFDLPNAYPDLATARKVLDDPRIIAAVTPEYEKAGIKFFGFSDAGFRQTSSSKPLDKIQDFQGLKIRTMENPNHMAYWTSIGANPTPMDFAEVYISLQQGTIDAQENPYDLIVANKLYEPQKYIVETNHLMHSLAMNMSKSRWDELPADLQAIVKECVEASLKYGREIADKRIASRQKIVTDYGCEISAISPELRQQILDRIVPVYDSIRKSAGDDLVDLMLSVIAEHE